MSDQRSRRHDDARGPPGTRRRFTSLPSPRQADGVDLPAPAGLSLFDDRAESVYAHYNDEVRNHIRAGHLLAERDAEIERLKSSRADRTSLWQRLRQWLPGSR